MISQKISKAPDTAINTDAKARLMLHLAGAEAAMRELYPSARVFTWANIADPAHADINAMFKAGDEFVTVIAVQAALSETKEEAQQ